jgi:hypothetical protein
MEIAKKVLEYLMKPFEWFGKAFSSSQDASYGRLLSCAAFLCMIGMNYIILHYSVKIESSSKTAQLISENQRYLFYLAALGYVATNAKDVLLALISIFNSKPATPVTPAAPAAKESAPVEDDSAKA